MQSISDFISFNSRDDTITRVKVSSLYNRPIRVLRWDITQSRYDDGSGICVTVTAELIDLEGEFQFSTGSKVIASQLEEIAKEMDRQGTTDRTFTCVIRSYPKFIKMMPVQEKTK